ncbi:MAG: hypothetical protein M1813_001325, partial [Trichoglossum hirsutum]
MPSTSLGTHLVKSMLVDPVIDELEMDRDEVFIHGIMCGLDSNSSYDLYDIIVHIVLAGLTRFSQPQYTAYVKAVILHSHAFLTEQNPGLNKYNTEIIDRLMYTLQAAGDENIPMVIPPSLPRQSVDGQQNQDSTVEPG